MKKTISLCVMLAALLFCARAADAFPASYLQSGWVDLDKYWYFDQGWTSDQTKMFEKNLYFEKSINEPPDKWKWDPDEIWTNHEVDLDLNNDSVIDSGWVSATDLSCWMASAAAMLSHQLNLVAREIYDEMLGWATAEDTTFWWTEGNWTHIALQEYLKRHDLTKDYYVKPYSTYSFPGNLGWINNSYDFAKRQLYEHETVGLGFFPVVGGTLGHAVTFWGWNETSLILADSDRYPWDINSYVSGMTNDHWYLDYLDPDPPIFDREVRYLVVLAPVPEPETWLLLAFGLAVLSFSQRRKTKAR
ncbi:PEP-CTERM sorting domain-containing protein [Trichloromonas sp.]|uniref:PEP-CTERM sorting domain-containing protein n=1 Tax=Trichloromonas sp. TaxID=3069249 RepID=UPI002A4304D5|nr:PEP-CTERM sorting domain-containing protein [Trichloromonas sp.]